MELQGTVKKIGETQTFASGFQKAKKRDKWVANISINNRTVYLGTFKNKDEAINCRLNYELNNKIKNKYNEFSNI